MGCASSKHQKRCRHCRRGYSPPVAPRSYSMHVHHPAQHTGDSYHMVALTSSTLGSLKLCDTSLGHNHQHLEDVSAKLLADVSNGGKGNGAIEGGETEEKERENFDLQEKIIEAKVWSSMMNNKIPKMVPKTPVMTPPGEPETINTWELMEGLEDISPLRSPNHLRSFSFEFVRSPPNDDHDHFTVDRRKSGLLETGTTLKPMWLQMEEDKDDSGCRVIDFDPEIISSFRKSLQELPKDHPFHIRIPDIENNPNLEFSDEHQDEEEEEDDEEEEEKIESLYKRPSFSKDKVILYFTSLRGIRKTYEDCCHVRVILKSIGVRVDERDVSMHSGFKDELKELLGDDRFKNGIGITLPRVFLGRKYVGGAEEIRKLNEDGKLEKLLESCERVEDSCNGGGGHECEACGDIRFVPCDTCSGSCKVYYESEEEEEEEYGFQRCPDCNENGLIRCPVCCD